MFPVLQVPRAQIIITSAHTPEIRSSIVAGGSTCFRGRRVRTSGGCLISWKGRSGSCCMRAKAFGVSGQTPPRPERGLFRVMFSGTAS